MATTRTALSDIPEESWDLAVGREPTIRRLAERRTIQREELSRAADELGIKRSRILDLVRAYRAEGTTASIAPQPRGVKKGSSRLKAEVEELIYQLIDTVYLTRPKPKMSKLMLRLKEDCRDRELPIPSRWAVERRVATIDQRKALACRDGQKAADDKFRPVRGSLEADRPLQIVQGDHTVGDLIIVDELYRVAMGRPILTLLIDVCTRVILGWYVSLEQPSATSLGLSLLRGVLPKAEWLRKNGIDADIPGFGLPETLSLDNAKAHHSKAFMRGCQQQGIRLHFRPVRRPHFGGHIERLIGTMVGEMHLLPGTTFSNIAEKGDYDAEGKACMTMGEFEHWLALQISLYHNTKHSALGVPPLVAWREAMEIHERAIRLPRDENAFVFDFLPYEKRKVRREGIVLWNIWYMHGGAQTFVNGRIKKFPVKYNPRDLSTIFLENDQGEHLAIPFKDRTRPAITRFEHDRALAALRERGERTVNEDRIFETIRAQRDLIARSLSKTKAARREAHRITYALAEGQSVVDSVTQAMESRLRIARAAPVPVDDDNRPLVPLAMEE